MNKDRSDLLDFCIGLVELDYGKQATYKELQETLELAFPQAKFSIEEVEEYYSLSVEIEDRYLTLKNSGNEG